MDFGEITRLLDEGRYWQAAAPLAGATDSMLEAAAQEICGSIDDPGERITLANDLLSAAPPPEVVEISERLAGLDTLRQLAVNIAINSVGEDWEEFIPIIQTLAGGASYRLGAALARLVARIASKDFQGSKSFWHECLTEDTPAVGACVLRGLAASEAPALEVLDLFSAVIADMRSEIWQTLGPRALPELGRREPKVVYSRLRDWAGRPEELARWNVAKALATPLGGIYIEEAMEILEHLAADERPSVWRAAAEAAAQIVQRRPAYVLPTLKIWRSDRRRLRCAELVLQILSKR